MEKETKIQMLDALIKLGEKEDEEYKRKSGLLNDLEEISWSAKSAGYKIALNDVAKEIGILK